MKKKKKMTPIIDEENGSYEKQKVCYICKKEFNTDENDKNEFNTDENDKNEFNTDENDKNESNTDENDKNKSNTDENDKNEFNIDENTFKLYHKVRDNCHYTEKFRGAADSICNLRYKTPKKIPVVFHNSSTYDYHFIINQLAKEFKDQLQCLGKNTEKYITFSVPIKKKNLITIKQLRTD